MHKEILNQDQIKLLSLLSDFRREFYLVGGTAIQFEEYIKMPSLLDLSAMKAYALGRRSKWKDYVDLYFLLNSHFTVNQIASRAEEIFGQLFSEKLFRAQLIATEL